MAPVWLGYLCPAAVSLHTRRLHTRPPPFFPELEPEVDRRAIAGRGCDSLRLRGCEKRNFRPKAQPGRWTVSIGRQCCLAFVASDRFLRANPRRKSWLLVWPGACNCGQP